MLIQAYQTSWIEDFYKIKTAIEETLKSLNISIEHVGSTAVPNLDAKPIIDIDIIYDAHTAFENIKTGLEKLGYFHNGNQGIPNRDVFKRNKTLDFHPVLDEIKHHLYVCLAESAALERHILFRDYLIANDAARVDYQNMKYAVAEEAHQDKKQYADIKEIKSRDFIDAIIEKTKKDKIIMLTHINPKLPMRDIATTKEFYINQLGFKEIGDYGDYLLVKKDHIEIHFFTFKTLDPKENYGQVYIRSNAIDAVYQSFIANNVAIHPNGHLQQKPWGQKEFSILDPDNNLLTFGESVG